MEVSARPSHSVGDVLLCLNSMDFVQAVRLCSRSRNKDAWWNFTHQFASLEASFANSGLAVKQTKRDNLLRSYASLQLDLEHLLEGTISMSHIVRPPSSMSLQFFDNMGSVSSGRTPSPLVDDSGMKLHSLHSILAVVRMRLLVLKAISQIVYAIDHSGLLSDSFYRSIAETLLKDAHEIHAAHSNTQQAHLYLSQLAAEAQHEIMILHHLFQLQYALDHFHFKSASTHLYSVKQNCIALVSLHTQSIPVVRTSNWCRDLHVPSSTKWFLNFYDHMEAKMTLYFDQLLRRNHDVITNQSNSFLFYRRLCRFYRDTKVTQITIMFEVTEAVQNYHPLGYICREKYYPRPTGIQAFVGVCHIPEDGHVYQENLPNIISVLYLHRSKMTDWEKSVEPICFYDDKVDMTYYLCQVGIRHYVVILYEHKRKGESFLVSFITELTTTLRNSSLF